MALHPMLQTGEPLHPVGADLTLTTAEGEMVEAELAVRRFTLSERIDQPFRLVVELVTDDLALDVMKEIVADATSPYRLTAITELGYARNMTRAASVLRELLNDEDPRIRVEAYEALLARRDRFIRTANVGPDNFALDRVRDLARFCGGALVADEFARHLVDRHDFVHRDAAADGFDNLLV